MSVVQDDIRELLKQESLRLAEIQLRCGYHPRSVGKALQRMIASGEVTYSLLGNTRLYSLSELPAMELAQDEDSSMSEDADMPTPVSRRSSNTLADTQAALTEYQTALRQFAGVVDYAKSIPTKLKELDDKLREAGRKFKLRHASQLSAVIPEILMEFARITPSVSRPRQKVERYLLVNKDAYLNGDIVPILDAEGREVRFRVRKTKLCGPEHERLLGGDVSQACLIDTLDNDRMITQDLTLAPAPSKGRPRKNQAPKE